MKRWSVKERLSISRSIERRKSNEVSLSRNSSNPVGGPEIWSSGTIGRNPDGRDRFALCIVRSRRRWRGWVVGFWSAEAAVRRGGCPWSGRGRHSQGPRVNDHRKPMCVTNQPGEPYSIALLTRTTYVSGCVCASLASLSLSLFLSLSLSLHPAVSLPSREASHYGPREKLPCPSNHHRWKRRPATTSLSSYECYETIPAFFLHTVNL